MQSKIGVGVEVGGNEFKTDERYLTSISRSYSHAINSKMNNTFARRGSFFTQVQPNSLKDDG